ncbi:class I SAM-dependent methyltransferase, partial [Patescibacteria group bacterium]
MRKQSFAENQKFFLENLLLSLRLRKIILHLKNLNELENIADLGCGYYGKSLKKLIDTFPSIKTTIGIDLSINKNQNNKKIKLIKSDLNKKIPVTENSFDVVISSAVLEHLENFEQFISETRRIL